MITRAKDSAVLLFKEDKNGKQKNAKKMGELTQTKEKLNELNQVKVPGAKDKAFINPCRLNSRRGASSLAL